MIYLADIYWVHNMYVPGIVLTAEDSEKYEGLLSRAQSN